MKDKFDSTGFESVIDNQNSETIIAYLSKLKNNIIHQSLLRESSKFLDVYGRKTNPFSRIIEHHNSTVVTAILDRLDDKTLDQSTNFYCILADNLFNQILYRHSFAVCNQYIQRLSPDVIVSMSPHRTVDYRHYIDYNEYLSHDEKQIIKTYIDNIQRWLHVEININTNPRLFIEFIQQQLEKNKIRHANHWAFLLKKAIENITADTKENEPYRDQLYVLYSKVCMHLYEKSRDPITLYSQSQSQIIKNWSVNHRIC